MLASSKLADLRSLGIILLTGEADGLMFRYLCDLTPNGKRVLCETFGATAFQENWNSSDGQVASAMIPYWAHREIAIVGYALQGRTTILTDKAVFVLEEGDKLDPPEYEDVVDADGQWQGIRKIRDYRINGDLWPSCYGEVERIFRPRNEHPHIGTRNVHAMSGRAV